MKRMKMNQMNQIQYILCEEMTVTEMPIESLSFAVDHRQFLGCWNPQLLSHRLIIKVNIGVGFQQKIGDDLL